MNKFSELERMAIQEYIATLVDFKDLDKICLDVTDIFKDQLNIFANNIRYYLTPIHSKEYFNKVRSNFHRKTFNEETAIKSIANLMYTEILRYRTDRTLFDFFRIAAYNDNKDAVYVYGNTDNITSDVINFIVENGLLNTVKYFNYMKPKLFYHFAEKNEAIQYKGYNFNEIKEWVRNAKDIITYTVPQNAGLTSFLCEIGKEKKPVYLLMNSYVVKINDLTFAILPQDIFEALFDTDTVTADGLMSYFFDVDDSYNSVLTSDEILKLNNRSTGPAANGESFNIDVPAGKTRIVIAYPATLSDIRSIMRTDFFDGDIKDVFQKSITPVELVPGGSITDYKVYTYIPGQPFISDMAFTVTL